MVRLDRSSHLGMFFKTSVFGNFEKFTEKHQCLFQIELKASTCNFIKKIDCGTGVFP